MYFKKSVKNYKIQINSAYDGSSFIAKLTSESTITQHLLIKKPKPWKKQGTCKLEQKINE